MEPLPKIPEYDSASLYPNTKRLSSSQVLLYLKDPQAFYVEHVLGAKRGTTPAMRMGQLFSACYADRSLPAFEMLKAEGFKVDLAERFVAAIARLPDHGKRGNPELPLIVKGKVFKDWEFRVTLDDYLAGSYTIIENKTGQVPWTQERANNDHQLTMQAWAHQKMFGMLPRRIVLNWWNTRRKTLDVQSFNTSRRQPSVTNFDKLMVLLVENIEAGNFSKPII